MTTSVPSQPADPANPASPANPAVMRPKDAATLIIVDSSTGVPKILLGKRRMDMKFMPGKYVFPGGRVDPIDRLVDAHDELSEGEVRKLLVDMKGGPSFGRARALALAAIRETYEEAGLVIGAPVGKEKPPEDASWQRFFSLGFAPRIAPVTFFARAITPPGRPRRFDTRFFCVDASAITFRGKPPEEELSDLVWMALEEARSLDLPPITRVVLEDLGDRLKLGPITGTGAAVPYYYNRNGTFRRDLISGLEAPPST